MPAIVGIVSPYVSAVSRDPTMTSGGSHNHDNGGSGRIPHENTKSKQKSDLEIGFMNGIFGGGAKRKGNGYRRGNDREMISLKKRREMYPVSASRVRKIGVSGSRRSTTMRTQCRDERVWTTYRLCIRYRPIETAHESSQILTSL